MTGSSNFDLMPTRYVAGLGALIGTLDGAARKARPRFRPQPARGTFEIAVTIMALRRSWEACHER